MEELLSFVLPTTPAGLTLEIEYVLKSLVSLTIFALAFKTIMYFFTNVFNIKRYMK